MRQLSEHDAAFVYSDSAHANSNVTLLHIYDQSTAPGGVVRFKQILAHVASRLDRLPNFRERILRVPMDLDYPYWIEDENFNIEYHVRHIALPKPGDWRQFCILASRIHARPLDLGRPLWEMYVIEGLDSFLDLPVGSFAVLLKTHYAATDVTKGNEITKLLHELSPEVPTLQPVAPWFPESAPGNLQLFWQAGLNLAMFPFRMAQPLRNGWTSIKATAKIFAGEFFGVSDSLPMTRFNTEVSAQRVFDTRRFALAEFKAIRTLVPKASVNDVVMAVCAGALRSYLLKQDELPLETLTAAVPFAVHNKRPREGHGQFSWVSLELATDLADPLERLAAIQRASASSSVMDRAVSARELRDLAESAPSLAIAATSKMLRSASAQLGDWVPIANCAITNVPGSRVPLYLQGARLSYLSAIMPISDGMGLVFSVTGYGETIVISFTACAEQVPDPEVMAQCLRDTYQDYLALAQRATRRKTRATAPADKPARVPRKRAPSKARVVKAS
jgi:diacylglycerol O-acyltransferase